MARRIRIEQHGGPEVLRLEQYEVGEPGPDEARVRQTAIGLNFIDTYFRSGLYPAPSGLPFTPGNEAAGVVEAVAEVGATLGIAPDELVAAVQSPAVKVRLKEETDRSIERGVFGSPFFFIDGEPFWGADRLNQVERWLRTGGW